MRSKKLRFILRLDSLIRHTDLKKYDSSYTEDKVDQHTYKIILIGGNNDTTKRLVYGNIAPKQLSEFSDKIISLKRGLQLSPTDTTVNFISRNDFFPPPIGAPIPKE